jgi:LAGLIDADG endonuclease
MYRITSLNDILIVLVPIFTNFPLLSTKLLDFNDFLKAINIKSKYVVKNLPISKLNKITKLKINMNRGRKKISVKEINQLSNQVNITSF